MKVVDIDAKSTSHHESAAAAAAAAVDGDALQDPDHELKNRQDPLFLKVRSPPTSPPRSPTSKGAEAAANLKKEDKPNILSNKEGAEPSYYEESEYDEEEEYESEEEEAEDMQILKNNLVGGESVDNQVTPGKIRKKVPA